MNGDGIFALASGAAIIGVLHTLACPDHYLPFAAMAGARKWSYAKTMSITFICGMGHLLFSIIIGFAGVVFGAALGIMEGIDNARSETVKWLFLAFAVFYIFYGLKHAFSQNLCHRCGTEHISEKVKEESLRKNGVFWALFMIFIFGPCEALIPMLMYPAAGFNWFGVVSVTLAFSLSTVAVMMALVSLLFFGIKKIEVPGLERWGHFATGFVLLACALFMIFAHSHAH